MSFLIVGHSFWLVYRFCSGIDKKGVDMEKLFELWPSGDREDTCTKLLSEWALWLFHSSITPEEGEGPKIKILSWLQMNWLADKQIYRK